MGFFVKPWSGKVDLFTACLLNILLNKFFNHFYFIHSAECLRSRIVLVWRFIMRWYTTLCCVGFFTYAVVRASFGLWYIQKKFSCIRIQILRCRKTTSRFNWENRFGCAGRRKGAWIRTESLQRFISSYIMSTWLWKRNNNMLWRVLP